MPRREGKVYTLHDNLLMVLFYNLLITGVVTKAILVLHSIVTLDAFNCKVSNN